ncbi:MAG: insulinase family protein [Evtepia sp.]
MLHMTREELMPGVHLTAVHTTKFKTGLIGFTFLDALMEETAAQNAMLPSLLLRGTQKYKDMEAISAALDELYGGSIDPMVRKKGETQCIGFVGRFLEDTYAPNVKMIESIANLMGEILLHPAGRQFVPAYFEGERENLIRGIRAQINDKRQYSVTRLTELMCEGEAYGIDKLGREETAAQISMESLWTRYQTLLHENTLHLYYCGSAPMDRVREAFLYALRDLPQTQRKSCPPCLIQTVDPNMVPRMFEERMDVTQGKLTLGFRIAAHTDLAALLMFNAIYGGSTTSKLFMNVRERLSLCYFASSMIEKYKGILFVSSGVEFDQYEKAKDEILAQLDACRNGDITKEELDAARRSLVSSLKTMPDIQSRLEDYWLGQAVANQSQTPEALALAVEAVSIEDVVAVANGIRTDSIYFLNGKEG